MKSKEQDPENAQKKKKTLCIAKTGPCKQSRADPTANNSFYQVTFRW